jgi:hypothetical protein
LIARDQDKAKPTGPGAAGHAEKLPYVVELWDDAEAGVEKILARAARVSLARAIFDAAKGEYPARRIRMRQGSKTLADSGSGSY